jgi:hypothetical protein
MPSSAEIGERLHKERTDLASLFSEHRGEDGRPNLSAEQVAEARRRNEAITTLSKEYDQAAELEAIERDNTDGISSLDRPHAPRVAIDDIEQPTFDRSSGRKSLGELFVASEQFKASQSLPKGQVGPTLTLDLEAQFGKSVAAQGVQATVFDTATSYVPQAVRLPTPLTPGEEGLQDMRLIMAVYEAARSGKTVKV